MGGCRCSFFAVILKTDTEVLTGYQQWLYVCYVLITLILTTALYGRHDYAYFTGVESEAEVHTTSNEEQEFRQSDLASQPALSTTVAFPKGLGTH